VAVDDDSAADIVARLRADARLDQPPELKFSQFRGTRSESRRDALAALFKNGGPLVGRAQVYLVDKHYFVTAKIVDLLLEEEANDRGVNLYADDRARQLAWTLFNNGPQVLGTKRFDRLIATMVSFASGDNRDESVVTVGTLIDEIRRAYASAHRASAHRQAIQQILEALLRTSAQARRFLDWLREENDGPEMEPLIPSLSHIAILWSSHLDRPSLLVDEQRVLTDDAIEEIIRATTLGVELTGPARHINRAPTAVRTIVRGRSQEHPSIQLADLVAGAGLEVARRHNGASSPAGDHLYPVVVPMISAESMVAHDDPTQFATVEGADLQPACASPSCRTAIASGPVPRRMRAAEPYPDPEAIAGDHSPGAYQPHATVGISSNKTLRDDRRSG
jgi:hypothetical protein